MANDEMGERSEKPTPRRLREARGKGQVAKSQDLGAVVGLVAATVILVLMGGGVLRSLAEIMAGVLGGEAPGDPFSARGAGDAGWWVAVKGTIVVAPIFGLLFVVAYLGQIVQVGFLVSTKPIQPKFNKLNPVSGAKKLISKRNLVKSAVNLVKLVVVVAIAWLIVRGQLPGLAALPRLGAAQGMLMIGKFALELALWLLLLLILLAIVDFLYEKWQHIEDLKMTKQEVKDERRSLEGDPEVKKRRFKMAQEIAFRQVQGAVPQADVVVTNPTHFSVALKYDSESMGAPRVVAKGGDLIAFRIRQIATAHGVPIVERPPLARGLFWGVEVGQEIPAQFYEAVAEILAFVYRTEAASAA